jgi:hypothetical protein
MVINTRQHSQRGAVILIELIMAIGIILIAMFPLAFSIGSDSRAFRATYQRAVAMEIVDGEMEILAAGAWRSLPEGTHPYPIQANAATNLPAGQFQFTRTGQHLRLQWTSDKKLGIGPVVREVTVK